jgi:hypothetical protein
MVWGFCYLRIFKKMHSISGRSLPDSNNRHHIQISLEILVKNINSSHNWKSPGGDQIHNFWLKKFTSIHKCLLDHFNGFIREPNTFPEFLAHGITYLKPKDSDTKKTIKI